jgi:hypothetical protein
MFNLSTNWGANAPTKTASTGTTTTPTTNLTVFTYTTNGTQMMYQDLTTASSASAIVPAGMYIITTPHASVKVQATSDGGTTWVDEIAVNTRGFFFSDGASVRLNNAAGSASLITVLTGAAGQPSAGTYTS